MLRRLICVSIFVLLLTAASSYAQKVEHFGPSQDNTPSEKDLADAKRAVQARAALRKELAEEKAAGQKLLQEQLAEEKAAGEKLIREQLAQAKAAGEKLLQEQLAEKKAKAERDLEAYITEKKAAAERKIFVPVETPSISGQPNVNAHAKSTESFEEFLKREQPSASAPVQQIQAKPTNSFEEFLKREQASSAPVRRPEPGLELNSLLSDLSIQLQPRPNPGLTDIQHEEAEKNRVKTVYSDLYKKYGGRRALSTFVIDNVSEVYGQSRFRLDVIPKGDRLSEAGARYGRFANSPTCHPYVGLSSELIPSKAEALKVNRGDEVHCWATIDPDGTECVYSSSNSRKGAQPQPLYTERFDTVQQFPHIRIKDRSVYIASGDNLKLVLFGSKQIAQQLCDSSRDRSGASEPSGDIGRQPEQREEGFGLAKGFRVWKDSTGAFSVKAEFSSVEDGSAVLQKTDSKLVRVRFERLCKEDRQYVLEQIKEQKREAEAKAERIRAEKEAEAEQAKREAEAKAKEEKIANLLQGTIPLDKFLKEEQALRFYDASLTQVQNQLRNQENTKAFIKNMDGKTVGVCVTISDVRRAWVTPTGDTFYQVDYRTGEVVRQFYVSSRSAETLNKGSEVVVKWIARSPRDNSRQANSLDSLELLGVASEIIQVSK